MKKSVNKTIKKFKESELKRTLFDHPVIKFICLLIVYAILTSFIKGAPDDYSVRIIINLFEISIVLYFILAAVYLIRRRIEYLMNPKNILGLIGAYAALIFVILLVFTTLFNFTETYRLGYIKYGACSGNFNSSMIGTDPGISREFFYFSAVTFFTVGYGDICPMGFAKLISIAAAFTGNLVSVILVALILHNYLRRKENSY